MRKVSGSIILICIIGILMTPFPLSDQDGVYNTFSGLYWCNSRSACIHEIGHKLDQEAGWVSQTQKFRNSLEIFIRVEAHMPRPDPLMHKIFTFQNFTALEIYAEIFRYSNGNSQNMPESFRKFYDWDRAKILINKIAR